MKHQTDEFTIELARSDELQLKLASRVLREDIPTFNKDYVTGVDVSYQNDTAYACAVVFHLPSGTITRTEKLTADCEYPYIPGHFYLREAPILISLLEKIQDTGPILVDGNGILHPRRMGLASFIGVKMDRQTIGVAKSLLLGSIENRRNNVASIIDKGEEIGAALWIGKKKKPVFVSIGNRISLETAIEVTLASSVKDYPEPLRHAHICSKNMLR